jgi:iron complex outermembrane recepter protein
MFNKERYLLAFMLSFSFLATMNVEAQDKSDDSVEEVVVTGSKISKDEFSSSSPITIISSDDILNAGNASVDEYLKYTPAFTGYQLGTSTNNGGDGSRKVNLRGLGFNRTLVLLNGKRIIGDIGGDGAVDIGGIPEMMIKRVEVLKDGASTIYGSDAISGVVNFILDDKFTGLKVQAGMGEGTENGQARDESIGMMAGIGGDNGNVVFSASWKNQKEMLQAEQPWANDALYPQLQDDGTFKAVGSGSSNSRKIRGPGGNYIYDSAIGAARDFTSADVYNYAPVNALITPNERTQMGVVGTLQVNDDVEMYFSGIYNRRYSHQRLAPDASFAVNSAVETPNNGAQYNDWVPADNPYNPFGSVACANSAADDGSAICDLGVRINRRFEESGGRLFDQTVDAYSIVTGFKFEAMGWDNDISLTFGETEQVDETLNYGRFDRWAVAVDPVACAANSSCPGVLNPFGEFGSISAEQMSFLTAGSLKDQSGSDFQMLSWVVSNDMLAFGVEKRQEYGYFKPDEFSAEGLTTGGASAPLRGGFSVVEVFGEYLNKVSDELTVDMSVRYSDYDTVGTSTNFKVGADYVLNEDVRLRASYGTGFRAPNVSELNTDASTTFPVIDLPCELGDRRLAAGAITQTVHSNCQALGYDTSDAGEYGFAWQSYHEYYADGNLSPEESTNFAIGAVVETDMLGGVQMSADYFNIEIEKVIALPIANLIFQDCLSQTTMDFSTGSCGLFIDYEINDDSDFGPNGLQYYGYPGDLETPWGNQGTFTTDGVDFALSTSGDLDIANINGYSVNFDATWHNSYEQVFTYGGGRDYVGSADGFAVYPELRYVLSLGVNGDNWNASWNIRHVSESNDVWRHPSVTADALAEATTYHDLSARYDIGNSVLRFGINNVADEKPPYFHSNFNGNTEPGVYDVIGRRMFMSVTATF